jgi:hypothetical protein
MTEAKGYPICSPTFYFPDSIFHTHTLYFASKTYKSKHQSSSGCLPAHPFLRLQGHQNNISER